MSSTDTAEGKRKAREMAISPRKSSKKLKALSNEEADAIIAGAVYTGLLEDHKQIFANFEGFAKDLLDKTTLVDNDPSAILKLMLVEGWLDAQGMICSKEGDMNLLWKQIRAYNSALNTNLAKNILPDLAIKVVGALEASSVEDLCKQTNEALKINNENLKLIVESSKKTLTRVSENEQKSIRRDLENEHLKLIGHDLDLKECDKKTGWEISTFARTVLNKNWYEANKILADKAVTSAKDVADNIYILGHNLMSRMTVTALGKDVKPNKSGVKTVSLLFTFATQADKDHFNTMVKSCGVSARSSLPKGYKDQQTMVMNMYPTFMNKTKSDIWTKVDVRQARQDEQMSFTVQSKVAEDRNSKWRTAGKVVVIAPANWGRLSPDEKNGFILESFGSF
jgi:hypothetical protein